MKKDAIKNEKEIDFDKIERTGGKSPIKEHYIRKKDFYEKGLYIKMLMSIAIIEQEGVYDRLIFVERIRAGIGYNNKLSDEYKNVLLIDDKKVDEFVKSLSDVEKISFIIDCFMMCGDNNDCNDEIKQYIAEICLLLSIDKKMLKEIINVTNVMLSQKLDVFKWNFDFSYAVFAKNFRYYLPVEEFEKYTVKVDFDEDKDGLLDFFVVENEENVYRKNGEEITFYNGFSLFLDREYGSNTQTIKDVPHRTIKIQKDCILKIKRESKRNRFVESIKLVHCLDFAEAGDYYIEEMIHIENVEYHIM